jgi:hypothetical protein
MSTFDYTKAQATAKRLIKRFGQNATLKVLAGSGDAWNPTQTPSEQPVIIAVSKYSNSQIDGTLVKQGDKKIYVSTEGATIAPDVGHKLAITGSPDHSIVNVMPLSPAGTVVYWEVQARS